jgi:glycosyltransferase involved in cell wall biosynthesis
VTSRKAVLMIAYSYYESDPRVIREAEAAVDGGFEVDFLALRKPGSSSVETIRGVRVIRLNQSKYRGGGHLNYILAYLMFFVRCFISTTVFFLRRRYRVIHINNMPDFLVFTSIIPRLCGAKVILDIHDPMPNTFASKFNGRDGGFFYNLLLWQERISAAYCNQVITVHEPVRDGILVKHGLAQNSVEVIANFADESLFPLQKSFEVNGKIRFVFHGTIIERSGLRLLMEALANVRNKDRILVKIIGEGDFSQTLTAMIHSMQLENVVTFDNHSYPVHEIVHMIGDCNVGLVPLEISSLTQYALPLKLIEYISLGLPVVTVRNEAISYYLGKHDCMFFEGNSPASLTAVLDRISDDPTILYHFRERSIALRGRFSWKNERRKYVVLLKRLTGAA